MPTFKPLRPYHPDCDGDRRNKYFYIGIVYIGLSVVYSVIETIFIYPSKVWYAPILVLVFFGFPFLLGLKASK
ncbi:hypothetical protein LCGC14_2793400 [marine sediment metagenome]|uniref:Uncharacterized protein n=1 Tax=marine sediment metagenome TaxID=412755 RepID=A0A0F8YPZ1_9ZZZZ